MNTAPNNEADGQTGLIEWHVDVEAACAGSADEVVFGLPRTGPEGAVCYFDAIVAVDRKAENSRLVVERVLRALCRLSVPVDD